MWNGKAILAKDKCAWNTFGRVALTSPLKAGSEGGAQISESFCYSKSKLLAIEFLQLLADDTNAEDLPPGTAQRERTNYERALQCSEELFLLDTIFAAALAPPPTRRIE